MNKYRITPTQNKMVEDLFEAFCDGDYPFCTKLIFDLGMTLGYRYYTLIFVEGINGEIFREPNLQISLIFSISKLRLGDSVGAHDPLSLHDMMGSSMENWRNILLSLCLRKTSFEEVLKKASTDIEIFQAYYYQAESLISDRNFDAALEMLKTCQNLTGECPERTFSTERLKWLKKHPIFTI